MTLNQLQPEISKILLLDNTNQSSIIKRLDDLFRKFGLLTIEKWRNMSNKKNTLLHELVEKDMPEVIRHLVRKHELDIDIRRDSDRITPFNMAFKNGNSKMCDLLKELGAKEVLVEDVSKWSSDEDKERSMNIVWLDLEMTSIEEPEILECAVIITDKELKELEKGRWVIHFEQSVLDSLGEWHQKTFANVEDGGNGLFADVVKSKDTKEYVEEKLLALIARHCPEGKCPLAGSSIHTDKDVLKKCMPKVNAYLHYRIIDVSSFQAVMRRWAPWMETKIKNRLATSGQEIVNHRAMDDIIWSISFMQQFRVLLVKQHEPNHHHHSPSNNHNKGASNYHNKGGSNEHNQGAPNYYNKGASNEHNQGAPNYYNKGASNEHNQGASKNQFKRSVSESNASENSDLPVIDSSVDPSQLYSDEKRLLERISFEKTYDVQRLQLTEKYQRIYDANPHLREVFMNKELLEKYDGDFTRDNRYLTTPIQRSKKNIVNTNPKKHSTTEHWGQRKLMLTEIEFLTRYGSDDNYLVIYAGAAPGSHVTYLSVLFPELDFVLIDDKEFTLKLNNKIQLRSEKFTNDMAQRYSSSSRKILFICNVRTFRPQGSTPSDGTEDMINQMDWHKSMKPQVSLLNFRLPLQSGKSQYFEGRQVIEPWASRRATECRLIVKKDAKMTVYNHQDFNEDLLNFHYGTRVMYYKHNMDEVEDVGLDHCYDCRAEIFILQEYLVKVQKVKNDNKMTTAIAAMSRDISKHIDDKKRPQFMNIPRTLDIIPKKLTDISTDT